MSKKLLHHLKFIVLICLTLMVMIGCQSHTTVNINSPDLRQKNTECRIIKHPLGETCIPLAAKRIVAMDEDILEVLLALDIKPIAVATDLDEWSSRKQQFWRKAKGIVSVTFGKSGLPNIEKMVLLHPDLILTYARGTSSEEYQLFSQIAPTVTVDYIQYRWKDVMLTISDIMNRGEQAQKVLAEYQQRVEQLQNFLNHQIDKTKVSISRFYAGNQNTQFRSKFSFPGSVILDVGLSLPDIQNRLPGTPILPFMSVSLETLNLLDADVMFVALDPGAEESFQKYQNSPLWQTLNVVKNNRVYTVDSGYWIFGNILSANAILDDLVKYLLEGS
jgi:iron complex transport system substrate-binding protein